MVINQPTVSLRCTTEADVYSVTNPIGTKATSETQVEINWSYQGHDTVQRPNMVHTPGRTSGGGAKQVEDNHESDQKASDAKVKFSHWNVEKVGSMKRSVFFFSPGGNGGGSGHAGIPRNTERRVDGGGGGGGERFFLSPLLPLSALPRYPRLRPFRELGGGRGVCARQVWGGVGGGSH